MKYALTLLLVPFLILFGLPGPAPAQYAIIEIEKVQIVKSLSGVVRDASGAPIAGATVAEVSADRKTVIQSTVTDARGAFALPQHRGELHHLMVSMRNFNPLVVHVKVSRSASKLLDLQLNVAT